MTVEMIDTLINGRWTLKLPAHRAEREQWGAWTRGDGAELFGWEKERWDSIHANLKPNDVVLDIGSEEMDLTFLMSSWGANVIPFEPNCQAWPNGKAIADANSFKAPLAWYVGFASDRTDEHGIAQIERFGWPECAWGEVIGDHGFASLVESGGTIPQITLDDFCTRHMLIPDAITMDVEGSELRVLKGSERILRAHRPLVWVSVHREFMMRDYGQTPEEMYGFMDGLGYIHDLLAVDHELHVFFWPADATVVAAHDTVAE